MYIGKRTQHIECELAAQARKQKGVQRAQFTGTCPQISNLPDLDPFSISELQEFVN